METIIKSISSESLNKAAYRIWCLHTYTIKAGNHLSLKEPSTPLMHITIFFNSKTTCLSRYKKSIKFGPKNLFESIIPSPISETSK